MPTDKGARQRQRGTVTKLPSGALRVRVYAGFDPVTGRRHYVAETVPAGPRAAAQAEKVRTRLLADVDGDRQPRTSATVAQLIERYLEVIDVEAATRAGYESLIRTHILPLLGALPVERVRGEVLDSFYAQLRSCRIHCRGTRGLVDHRTRLPHDCDRRCRQHRCRPLGPSGVRQAHVILNSAFAHAVRWEWVGTNPCAKAVAPRAAKPKPQPPSASQAARISSEAWRDPVWGLFVWLAMTSGARRGELCALRWDRIDFASAVVTIRTSIAEVNGQNWEKDTKDHQQRRIVLDAQTLGLLRALLVLRAQEAETLGFELPEDGFVFSPDPDSRSWPKPATMTRRFTRMCAALGYDIHLHQLRHYSATELISGGVDVRIVAGRLGHGGGGVTTLRYYTAWVAEADQRASRALADRVPQLPSPVAQHGAPVLELPAPLALAEDGDSAPYRRIAADLRGAIRIGALKPGDLLPTVVEIGERYAVSPATAHRAVALLADSGEISVSRGRRAMVNRSAT
jgi:integrase